MYESSRVHVSGGGRADDEGPEGGRVVNVQVLTGCRVIAHGHREILGVDVTTSEDGAGWLAFSRGQTDAR